MNDAGGGFIRVGALGELRDRRRMVISTPGGPVLIVADSLEVVALDNRCPHMGFPLHRGSIEDGILTCHWHHARFDLRTACRSKMSTILAKSDSDRVSRADAPRDDKQIIAGHGRVEAAKLLGSPPASCHISANSGLAPGTGLQSPETWSQNLRCRDLSRRRTRENARKLRAIRLRLGNAGSYRTAWWAREKCHTPTYSIAYKKVRTSKCV
jgi:nitrite reductase/ring-hydroxylating ferredoxin subunit